MIARRATATMNLFENGHVDRHVTVVNLRYLRDWAAAEIRDAATPEYREHWRDEWEAASNGLLKLEKESS